MCTTALLSRGSRLNSLGCVKRNVLQFQGLDKISVPDKPLVGKLEVLQLAVYFPKLLYSLV